MFVLFVIEYPIVGKTGFYEFHQSDKILNLPKFDCDMRHILLYLLYKPYQLLFGQVFIDLLKIRFNLAKVFILVIRRIFSCNCQHFVYHVKTRILVYLILEIVF